MTNASRITKIGLLAVRVVAFAATSRAQKPPIAEQVAKTYGIDL